MRGVFHNQVNIRFFRSLRCGTIYHLFWSKWQNLKSLLRNLNRFVFVLIHLKMPLIENKWTKCYTLHPEQNFIPFPIIIIIIRIVNSFCREPRIFKATLRLSLARSLARPPLETYFKSNFTSFHIDFWILILPPKCMNLNCSGVCESSDLCFKINFKQFDPLR